MVWGTKCGRRTVIVYEIGDADTEEGGFETRVKAGYAFSLDYSSYGIVGGGMCSLGFDLGAGGEGDKRVAGGQLVSTGISIIWRERMANVNAMDRRPPPAPAKAWATVSACWVGSVLLCSFDMMRQVRVQMSVKPRIGCCCFTAGQSYEVPCQP